MTSPSAGFEISALLKQCVLVVAQEFTYQPGEQLGLDEADHG